jgi:hypothetical protein
MDIFAHGLWTYAAAKALNKKIESKSKKPLRVWRAAFWGIFPDLFAFAIPFTWIAWSLAFGGLHISDIPRPQEVEPPTGNTYRIVLLANSLYSLSHSAIIFIAVFLLIWLMLRRPVLELGGWFLHILIDVPTHSYQFYPTPVLWPLSDWKFHGISWATPWFMILNYSALAVIYFILWRKRKAAAPQGKSSR